MLKTKLVLLKYLLPLALVVGAYFYGFSAGGDSRDVAHSVIVIKAQEEATKSLKVVQEELQELEQELLESSDIKVEYRTKVKEVIKYVDSSEGNDLSKCYLDDVGMHKLASAYK